MSCKISEGFFNRARRLLTPKPKGEDVNTSDTQLRAMTEDMVAIASRIGGNEMDDFIRGNKETYNDIDAAVKYITSFGGKGGGFDSLEALMKHPDLTQRDSYVRMVKVALEELVKDSPNPSELLGMKEELSSAAAVNALYSVGLALEHDANFVERIPILGALQRKLGISLNPFIAAKNWFPTREAMVRNAQFGQGSGEGYNILANNINKLMGDAAKLEVFRQNKISRNILNRMLPALDGVDFNDNNQVGRLSADISRDFNIDNDQINDVMEGLRMVKDRWDAINYGAANIGKGEIETVVANAGRNTVVGLYKYMHEYVQAYYDKVVEDIGETGKLFEVKRILEQTDITKKARLNYMPTYDSDLYGKYGEISSILGDSKLFVPSNFRPKEHFGVQGENADFEKMIITNLLTNRDMFNRMLMTISREHMDINKARLEYQGLDTDPARINSVNAATDLIRKIDYQLNYDRRQDTEAAKALKMAGTFPSLYVISAISGPRSAGANKIYNTFARWAASINVGTIQDIGKIKKSGSDADRYILDSAQKLGEDFVSTGLVQQFASPPKGFEDAFLHNMRRFGQFLADGGIVGSASDWYKENFVYGGQETKLRSLIYMMAYAETKNRAKLANLDYATDKQAFMDFVDKSMPEIIDRAYEDLTVPLAEFSSLGKPLFAHISLETADTAPKVATAMFTKYWWTFRHVMVNAIDNTAIAVRRSVTGTDQGRWDYGGAADSPGNINEKHFRNVMAGGGALGSMLALGMWMMVRDFLRKEDPEEGVEEYLDMAARWRLPLAETVNPMRGVEDLTNFFVAMTGLRNVTDEEYERYKAQALNFTLGMAGGNYAKDRLLGDRTAIEGLTNILTAKSNWVEQLSEGVIEAGYYGKNLRDISKEFRADTAMFRHLWALNVPITMFEATAFSGILGNVDDKKQGYEHAARIFSDAMSRWSGLVPWVDTYDMPYEVRQKYVTNNRLNQALNAVERENYASVASLNSRNVQRHYNAYANRVRQYRPQYIQKPRQIRR